MNNEKGVRLMAANTNEKQQIQFDAIKIGLASPEKIREWNQLGTEEALPGTRLLILKNIPSSRS